MQTDMSDPFVVLTTVGSQEEARRLARALVEERLVACCNLVGAVQSIYRWQGKLCEDDEVLILAKTTRQRLESVRSGYRILAADRSCLTRFPLPP